MCHISEKARIPIKDRADCLKKFKKYEIGQSLEKCKKRKSETYRFQIKEFEQYLDDLLTLHMQMNLTSLQWIKNSYIHKESSVA